MEVAETIFTRQNVTVKSNQNYMCPNSVQKIASISPKCGGNARTISGCTCMKTPMILTKAGPAGYNYYAAQV